MELSSYSTIMLQSQVKYSNRDFSGASIYTSMRERRCRIVYTVTMPLFKKGKTIRNHLHLAVVDILAGETTPLSNTLKEGEGNSANVEKRVSKASRYVSTYHLIVLAT